MFKILFTNKISRKLKMQLNYYLTENDTNLKKENVTKSYRKKYYKYN